MQVIIRYIDRIVFDDYANKVILPGLHGKLGIKPNHAAISVILTTGEIHIKSKKKNKKFEAIEGIAQISNNVVNILLTD
jgi:F0F1-type ATP synthase epsilon subunit